MTQMDSVGADIAARGISARGSAGSVFENVTFDIPAGGLAAVVGPAGSGRTSLLWAIAGRMALVTGQLAVGEHVFADNPGKVREQVAVARLHPGYELDPHLRVRELVSEHELFVVGQGTEQSLASALALLEVDVDSNSLYGELSPPDQLLFAVGLAASRNPGAIVVDDVEAGCTYPQTCWLWDRLATLADSGPTVIASSTDLPETSIAAAIVLPHPRNRDDLRNPTFSDDQQFTEEIP